MRYDYIIILYLKELVTHGHKKTRNHKGRYENNTKGRKLYKKQPQL